MRKPTILIADDQPIVRQGVAGLLSPEFDIVASVAQGALLQESIVRHRPQGLVVDIRLPGLNGLEAARKLKSAIPSLKIVVFTTHSQPAYVQEAFRAGITAYVCKTSPAEELLGAVRSAIRGVQHVSIPGSSWEEIFDSRKGRWKTELFRGLTGRQREVLRFLAEGDSAKMIAAKLGISARTVEFHKASLLAVLNMSTTAELIRYAVESGIVERPGLARSTTAN